MRSIRMYSCLQISMSVLRVHTSVNTNVLTQMGHIIVSVLMAMKWGEEAVKVCDVAIIVSIKWAEKFSIYNQGTHV